MAVIEVCDICRREVSDANGITVNCSDWNGLEFIAGVHPSRIKRNYKMRICDKCKENIIKYCKEECEVKDEEN
jgi:hypothetical protein